LQIHISCIERILEKVDEKYKDQARTFFRKLFLNILQSGHGTLIAIIEHETSEFPNILKDGIKLDEKIDIIEAIQELSKDSSLVANSKIDGYFALLKGMLSSDGVTIFANDGSIRGYNVFIAHTGIDIGKEKFGGSRKRTFNSLTASFDSNLVAAFLQSQDGNIQFNENEK
jgi:hypothetical protein